MHRGRAWGLLVPLALLVAGCATAAPSATAPIRLTDQEETPMPMSMTSESFVAGQAIPAEYTCDGDNVSPHLRWSGVPERARSLVLVVDDPDSPSGTWAHWILYDLPPDVTELPEAQPDLGELPDGAKRGRNSFKNIGYGGPCPPKGPPHRYYFRLYALDTTTRLAAGASRQEVEAAMAGHILAEAELMGTYQRR
jgi:Raf kinase inhibitor-like YbhB/YbcL family protein